MDGRSASPTPAMPETLSRSGARARVRPPATRSLRRRQRTLPTFQSRWRSVPATVAYHGRSVYPGFDQINVIVPSGAAPGCYVSIVVRSGGIVSNFATIPLSADGNFCLDKHTGISGSWLAGKDSFTI